MKKTILLVFLLSTAFGFSQNSKLIPFVSNSKWGFSDRNGKLVIQPVYDSVGFFNTSSVGLKDLTFAYVYQNKKMGVIDSQSKLILPVTYQFVKNIRNTFHFIATTEQGKMGLVGESNQIILPFEYDAINEVVNDSYILNKNKKIGLADANGKIVIPVIYDQIVYMDEDEATNKCRWRVNNEKVTQYLFTAIYENPNDEIFQTVGVIESTEDSTPNYTIDENSKDFEEKIPIRYQSNLYLLRNKNLYGFSDFKEKIGFKPKFKKLDYFFNSYDFKKGIKHYLLFEENNKKGLVDGNGNVLLEADYDTIKKEYHYLEVVRETKTGVYFLSTDKVIFSNFTSIIKAVELDDEFVVALVTNDENNSYYYIGENGIIFKK
jgi:hypothetical protein